MVPTHDKSVQGIAVSKPNRIVVAFLSVVASLAGSAAQGQCAGCGADYNRRERSEVRNHGLVVEPQHERRVVEEPKRGSEKR